MKTPSITKEIKEGGKLVLSDFEIDLIKKEDRNDLRKELLDKLEGLVTTIGVLSYQKIKIIIEKI